MSRTETLESRRLLSVSVHFDGETGELMIQGDDQGNVIRVTAADAKAKLDLSGDSVRPELSTRWVTRPGAMADVAVFDNGKIIYHSGAAGDSVRSIRLLGGDGDDQLEMQLTNRMITSATIDGGDGNDYIVASATNATSPDMLGGFGNDTIIASYVEITSMGRVDLGAGDDFMEIHVAASDVLEAAETFHGGEGDDIMLFRTDATGAGFRASGGDGNDYLEGSAANDSLFGDAGDDIIRAREGDDYLDGGDGNDQLYGDDGDDFLIGGAGFDWIDGGEGDDTGLFDEFDIVLSIEN